MPSQGLQIPFLPSFLSFLFFSGHLLWTFIGPEQLLRKVSLKAMNAPPMPMIQVCSVKKICTTCIICCTHGIAVDCSGESGGVTSLEARSRLLGFTQLHANVVEILLVVRKLRNRTKSVTRQCRRGARIHSDIFVRLVKMECIHHCGRGCKICLRSLDRRKHWKRFKTC